MKNPLRTPSTPITPQTLQMEAFDSYFSVLTEDGSKSVKWCWKDAAEQQIKVFPGILRSQMVWVESGNHGGFWAFFTFFIYINICGERTRVRPHSMTAFCLILKDWVMHGSLRLLKSFPGDRRRVVKEALVFLQSYVFHGTQLGLWKT